MSIKYYKITLGSEEKVASETEAMTVADAMVMAQGGGVPKIVPCDAQGNEYGGNTRDEIPPPPPSAITMTNHVKAEENKHYPKAYSDWHNTVVDEDAKKRIEAQHAVVEAAGGPKIDTRQQFFATGTRMAQVGYETQERRYQEHLNKLPLREAIEELQDTVSNEIRRDYELTSKEIANNIEVDDGELYIKDHLVRERALRGILFRLNSPALSYLLGLQERVEKERVLAGANHEWLAKDSAKLADILRHECLRNPDVLCKIRMREYPRDIYAILSPDYVSADAPMIMEQIVDKMPTDARGSWAYDPDTTYWELRAEVFTPTPVEEQAVGEAFSAYVSYQSRDSGNGRFNAGGGINLLRCLNASTYSVGSEMSSIHRGKIISNIDKMSKESVKAIHALCMAWGKGRETVVDLPSGISINDAIPGFWRSLLKEGDLAGVLKGRKENHVNGLTQRYFEQRRDSDKLVLSDFAQSWTRYVQDQPMETRREAEMAVGHWLVKPPREMKCELKDKD